jgi:succinate dehydrogenase/fumarate reductase cytochrome b subunit
MSIVGFAGMILFVFYYTPYIVEAQAQGAGATTTDMFASMHKQSEWIMKVILIAQSILFGRRIWILQKK